VDVSGVNIKSTIQPNINDVVANNIKTFKLENPKILIDKRSLLFLISIKNFKLDKKIMKGSSFIIKPGI
jgi:hypothetical protein